MKNKFLKSCLLAAAMGATAAAGYAQQSWNCGKSTNEGGAASVTAVLNNGVLSISGTGEMADYTRINSDGANSYSNAPWRSDRANIHTLIIGEGVTSVGNWAFLNHTALRYATIPSSVTAIGTGTFLLCSGVKKLTLADSDSTLTIPTPSDPNYYPFRTLVTDSLYLGRNFSYPGAGQYKYPAFGMRSVKQLTCGSKVTSIPAYAFYQDTALVEVIFSNSVASIGEYAFYECRKLTGTLNLPGVAAIGYYAFYYCTSITALSFSANIRSIGYSFAYCRGITGALHFPNGLTTISGSAFEYCSGITSVSLPNSVTTIGSYAFRFCTSLASINIPNSITAIPNNMLHGCTSLTTVTIPNSVTSIGDAAFRDCAFKKLVIENGADTLTLNGTAGLNNYSFYSCAVDTVHLGRNITRTYTGAMFGTGIKHFTVGASVTAIPAYAFSSCTGLTQAVIPSHVTSIEQYAFSGCSGLTAVAIPSSVTTIGTYAFQNCSSLPALTIPGSVTSIGNFAFNGCTGLKKLVLDGTGAEADLPSFGVLSNCTPDTVHLGRTIAYTGTSARFGTAVKVLTIGNGVRSIPQYAFYSCAGLTGAVTIPSSVTSIGERAFYGCSSATSLTLLNSPTSIGSYAFYNNTGLASVSLGNGVTSIGNQAFRGCTGLTGALNLPNSVTSIGNEAFYGCTGITGAITIPNTATSVGNSAFENCSSLAAVSIGGSVESIGTSAFKGCTAVKKVAFENGAGTLTLNGTSSSSNYSFYNCAVDTVHLGRNITRTYTGSLCYTSASVKQLTIGETVTSIAAYAFTGCTGLTGELNLPNSVTAVEQRAFNGCTNIIGALNLPNVTSVGDYAFYNCSKLAGALTLSSSVTSIGERAFYSCSGLTGGLNLANVTSVGTYAFYNCSGLTGALTLSNSVASIGDYAFYNCNKLTGALNLSGVTTLGNGAFYSCSSLDGALTLPNSLTSIGYNVFRGCTGLTGALNIPNVTSIGSEAFYGCNGLTGALNLPNVTSIGNSAFQSCRGFTSLALSDSIKSIGYSAFSNCTGFTGTLAIPEGVESIDYNAFAICSGFTGALHIPKSLTTLGSGVFQGCTGLTSVSIPDNITSLGQNLFLNCTGLTAIVCLGSTPPAVGNANTFQGVSKTACCVYVPTAAVNAYKAEANWGFSCVEPITYAEAVNVTYGAISDSLSAKTRAPLNETLTYQWYSNTADSNAGGTLINGATGASFTIPAHLTAGTHYYYCAAALGTADLTTNAAAVVVAKATATGVPQTEIVVTGYAHSYHFDLTTLLPNIAGLTGVTFSPAVTDNASGLLGELDYTEGHTLIIPVNNVAEELSATITVAISSDNYEDFTADITVTATNKKLVDITGVTVADGVYNGSPHPYAGTPVLTRDDNGETVTGVTLEVLYASTDGKDYHSATAPANAGEYRLTLKVPDNHAEYIGQVSFEFAILKATAAAPTGLTATVGDTLSSVLLPAGWAWAAPADLVGEAGEQVHKANYTPSDTANYNTLTDVDLTVTVSAKTYTVTVTNGTGNGEYEAGATVTITANAAPAGQQFKEWTTASAGVTFANANSATTTFEMPANAVTITAVYEEIPITAVETQSLTSLKARSQNGTLYVNGLTAGKAWSVYSISGSLVYQGTAGSEEATLTLNVPTGIYVVVQGKGRVKVAR